MVGQWAALQRYTNVRECKGGNSGWAVGSTAALYICSAVLVSCTNMPPDGSSGQQWLGIAAALVSTTSLAGYRKEQARPEDPSSSSRPVRPYPLMPWLQS